MSYFLKTSLSLFVIGVFFFSCGRGKNTAKTPFHFNPNMDSQEKVKAQGANYFFNNKPTMLLPPEGTIAQGKLKDDKHLYFGKNKQGKFVNQPPSLKKLKFNSKEHLLKRGKQRYDIYCSACHGYSGNGRGTVALKGYKPAPADLRVTRGGKKLSKGELYAIITQGYPLGNLPVKTMPAYNISLDVRDRWAVVEYLQVLKDAYKNYKNKEK